MTSNQNNQIKAVMSMYLESIKEAEKNIAYTRERIKELQNECPHDGYDSITGYSDRVLICCYCGARFNQKDLDEKRGNNNG